MKSCLFQLKIDKIFEVRTKYAKNLKFYVEILKKKGHWVYTVVKKEVIGCKICAKRGHNTGR